MKVLRAAVALGLSTPLVVLACGSDDASKVVDDGGAGEGGAGAVNSGGSSAAGKANTGGSLSDGGNPADGGAGGAGATDNGGAGGVGATDAGGAGGVGATDAGGAGGVGGSGEPEPEPEPVCGDATLGGGLLCFDAPVPLTLLEGTPTDLVIGAWDDKVGLDVIVANSGNLSYYSNDAAGGFVEKYNGTPGVTLAVGQLDSGSNLDFVINGSPSGTANFGFGDGTGAAPKTASSNYNSEGAIFNFFVANVVGSSASQDIIVTSSGTVSVVLTTGTEGEGFEGAKVNVFGNNPQDAVLAKLGSAQWLVSSAPAAGDGGIERRLLTVAPSLALGNPQPTPVGGPPAQLDLGDFDEDGFDDVVSTLSNSANVSVLFGDGVGTGGFKTVSGTDQFLTLTVDADVLAKTERDVKVGDFNGDGHADIAVSVFGLDSIAIFFGDGKGAFSAPHLLSSGVGSGPARLAVGDLNGDSVDDLVVVGEKSSKVIILLSDP